MKARVKAITAEEGLSPDERETTAAWAKQIFGPMELARRYTWTEEWRYTVLVYCGAEAVSSLRIVERTAIIDGAPVLLGGVAGVMTPREHRGRGYASLALRAARAIILEELEAQLGLLLCSPDLISFYTRRGWRLVDCPLRFDQPAEKGVLWPENVMILPRPGERWAPKAIDLCGPPW